MFAFFFATIMTPRPNPGFSITPEELYSAVTGYIQSNAIAGWANMNQVIGGLKGTDLRWANALERKSSVERALSELFGPKEDAKPKEKVWYIRKSYMCECSLS